MHCHIIIIGQVFAPGPSDPVVHNARSIDDTLKVQEELGKSHLLFIKKFWWFK